MNLDELSQLAIKHKTDKWGKHHYTPVYFNLFNESRLSIKKMLEVGIGEGASMRMWQDFFPNATIFGGEIDPKRIFVENRINITLCDQSSSSDLDQLLAVTGFDLDFVVEDGSHIREHQIYTCKYLMSKLARNCIYVIEDVADPTIFEELKMFDCEMITVGKRYDDRLLIVRHV